jgi:hypothetical protein
MSRGAALANSLAVGVRRTAILHICAEPAIHRSRNAANQSIIIIVVVVIVVVASDGHDME